MTSNKITKTILLDLDDTLLSSNMMAKFLPAYLKLLGKALGRFMPPEKSIPLLFNAVSIMQNNTNATTTNREAFDQAFFPHFTAPQTDVEAAIEEFYRQDYPTLRQHTTLRPTARPLVKHLIKANYQVVIATNPLFPLTAIQQRLDWSNALDFPYNLITSMENMHFCKPNPHYYQEILAKINASPTTTLMVGDDSKNDIIPAQAIGLKTWWITNQDNQEPPPTTTYQGTLADFYHWITK